MNPEEFKALTATDFIKFLARELRQDYEYFSKKLEIEPKSNTAYDYLQGYVDYCESILALVERHLKNNE